MNDDGDQVVLTRAADDLSDESISRDVGVTPNVTDAASGRRARIRDVTWGSTASRPLDGLTRDEVGALALAAIDTGTVGRFTASREPGVTFEPVDPGDRVFESSFNDYRLRPAGDRLFGPDAVAIAIDLFQEAGWSVRVADATLVLDGSDPRRAADWLEGRVGAAVEQRPALKEWADEYLRTRRAQLDDGSLRIVVHTQDVLAWSP